MASCGDNNGDGSMAWMATKIFKRVCFLFFYLGLVQFIKNFDFGTIVFLFVIDKFYSIMD